MAADCLKALKSEETAAAAQLLDDGHAMDLEEPPGTAGA